MLLQLDIYTIDVAGCGNIIVDCEALLLVRMAYIIDAGKVVACTRRCCIDPFVAIILHLGAPKSSRSCC